nr:MAG TPA: hypothetical protein [Caudoviricetes sp.]
MKVQYGTCSATQDKRVSNRCSGLARHLKIYGNMIKFIKRVIFAWKYKRAVKKAIKLANLTGLRYFVVYMNGSLKVAPKKTFKQLIAQKRFRKGTTIQDIERSALFITK